MADREEVERARSRARQPAGLESAGRDESLTSAPEVHPSGMRADSRSAVPGTEIPDPPAADRRAALPTRLLRLIEGTSHPELGLDEMARQLGISQAQAGRLIEELEADGRLRWQGERPVVIRQG